MSVARSAISDTRFSDSAQNFTRRTVSNTRFTIFITRDSAQNLAARVSAARVATLRFDSSSVARVAALRFDSSSASSASFA